MKVLPSASLGVAALAAVLLGAPAHAIPSSFVSETGSGTACTRTAPCATFQAAHNAADAGGEISCIDDGNFASGGADGLTITKSVTIDCVGTVASLSGFTDTGILIDTAGVRRYQLSARRGSVRRELHHQEHERRSLGHRHCVHSDIGSKVVRFREPLFSSTALALDVGAFSSDSAGGRS